jgi:hypothetical protein
LLAECSILQLAPILTTGLKLHAKSTPLPFPPGWLAGWLCFAFFLFSFSFFLSLSLFYFQQENAY